MQYKFYGCKTSTSQRENINTTHPFSIYINSRNRITDTSEAYLAHTGRIIGYTVPTTGTRIKLYKLDFTKLNLPIVACSNAYANIEYVLEDTLVGNIRKPGISTVIKNLCTLTNVSRYNTVGWDLEHKMPEFDFTIQHISGNKNVVADTLSRIYYIQTRSQTRKLKFSKFPERSLKEIKNIAIFTSSDIMYKNFLISTLSPTISDKGDIEVLSTHNHIVFIHLYQSNSKETFSQLHFLSLLKTYEHYLFQKQNTM